LRDWSWWLVEPGPPAAAVAGAADAETAPNEMDRSAAAAMVAGSVRGRRSTVSPR
jgi:hypothetical protein